MSKQYNGLSRRAITGMNSNVHPSLIGPTQCEQLINADLVQLGRTKKRDGFAVAGNLVTVAPFTALARFNPYGGTDGMLGIEGINLRHWLGTGNWSASDDAGFTTGLYTKILIGNDIALILNGTENVHTVAPNWDVADLGDANTSPPKGTVGCWLKDRWFIADKGIVYFSDVGVQTFLRDTNYFRVSVGDNDDITNLVPFRNNELIIFKEHSTWLLQMDNNSTPLTQWDLKPIDTEIGCISREAAIKVGNDIFFFASDGVRSLKRNEQDKVSSIQVPLSDDIHSGYIDTINWTYKNLIRAVSYQNRVIFSIPYDDATTCDKLLVYFLHSNPQLNGWSMWETEVGAFVGAFAKSLDGNNEKLYFAAPAYYSQMFEMFSGDTDWGTGISYTEKGRIEDLTEEGLTGNQKYAKSFMIKGNAASECTAILEMSIDEGAFQEIAEINMNTNAPYLPIDLTFVINDRTITLEKFSLDELEHFYSIQYKITQAYGKSQPLKFFERQYVLATERYEPDGGVKWQAT